MTRVEQIERQAKMSWGGNDCQQAFIDGAEYADTHPVNQWHKVDDGDLPPEDKNYKSWSIKVWATDGKHYGICRYDFEYHDWLYFTFKMNEVTHWMYLPTLSKKEG